MIFAVFDMLVGVVTAFSRRRDVYKLQFCTFVIKYFFSKKELWTLINDDCIM